MNSFKVIGIATLVFAVIAGVAYAFTQEIGVVGGIGLAYLISIAISIYKINEQWEGKIYDIKDVRMANNDGEFTTHKTVRYAFLKTHSGKTKKFTPMPDWKVGDKIVKVKGEFSPKRK